MKKFLKKHKRLITWLTIIISVVIIYVIGMIPTNDIIESPGDATAIKQYIKTDAGKPTDNFYMVTVSERPAVVFDYLFSPFNKYETRYSRQQVMGNIDNSQYDQLQKWYMQSSQDNAIYYVAKKAKLNPQRKFMGVYVLEVTQDSTFKNKLKVGDLITTVNKYKFNSVSSMISYINHQKLGSKVKISILRNNKVKNIVGKIIKVKGTNKAGIGIQLVEHVQTMVKPQIEIDAGQIGGPSAGLMFSLECYQIFTHQDLTHNQKIAGTGTIDDAGNIGIIGGIDKKVVAANRIHAKVFFAPTQKLPGMKESQTNYEIAKKTVKQIHSKMKIIPVATFDDALKYLRNY